MKRAIAASGFAAAAFLGAMLFWFATADPAAADNHRNGNGDGDPLFAWDTDNLRYNVGANRYSARTFGVPFHEYSGYRSQVALAACVEYHGSYSTLRPSRTDGTCPPGSSAMANWCLYTSSVNSGYEYAQPARNQGSASDRCPWRSASRYPDGTLYGAGSARLCLRGGVYYVCTDCGTNRATASVVSHQACQSGVEDAFSQTVSGGRNDFPVLSITDPDSEEASAAFKNWGAARNRGCDEFAAAQDRLLVTSAANGGYYLDSRGNLETGTMPAHAVSSRSSPSRTLWSARSGFTLTSGVVTVGAPLTVPTPNWPATRKADGTVSWPFLAGFNYTGHLSLPMAIGGTQPGVWCPAGFHPRGEDGVPRVGRGSGRTLTSLDNEAKIVLADRFWCRSDVRYQIGYRKQTHAETCGADPRPACPSGVTLPSDRFSAYGRANCYHTFISLDTAASNTCLYRHPVPQCADADSGTKREWTQQELATYDTGEKFPAKTDGTTPCGEAAEPDPPDLADFTADPCVTVSLSIAENRIAGSAAEPGVISSDRTLAAAAGRTAWDLDIASPHPLTASPPRDATAGTGDPDGCADGSESRADHAASSGAAARRQSPAPAYAASGRTDTAAPPNDADGDIDYTGAVRNMSHRYASKVAENTCSVKRSEAEAELALLEVREAAFTKWLSDYKTAADSNAANMRNYRRAPAWSGSGLAVLRGNDMEAAKAAYAALLAPRYTALSSALSAAKTAYDTATDRTAGDSRAAVITAATDRGCAAHYTSETARLKKLFSDAETAALSSISAARTAIAGTALASAPSISNSDTTVPYSRPSIAAVWSRTERSCEGLERTVDGQLRCYSTSELGLQIPFTATRYYTCPGGSYSIAGTASRTYKTTTRSAGYSTTFTARSRGESTDNSCPGWASARTSGFAYATKAAAVRYALGSTGSASRLPAVSRVAAPAALVPLGKGSLLGSYYLSHGDRANLEAAVAADRNAAANSLSVSAGSVPSGSPQKIEDYQTAYKTAYDAAYRQAEGHMSGTAWESFDWRYQASTLAWGSYAEDGATTFRLLRLRLGTAQAAT